MIAIVIALPISYWAAQSWLQGFAYSIEPEWYYFKSVECPKSGVTIANLNIHYPKVFIFNSYGYFLYYGTLIGKTIKEIF
ncbi:hypothetical protein [uncultured Marivirga sp.]|uniref:hypothetical protein n=1 Tax=uncultured Marivirga sp. TaxID=1123707 RepID=UPI0030EC65EA